MTNKTSLTRTLMTACSILALSAVMYGCVGGGDDGTATPVTDKAVDEAAAAEATAVAAARDAARGEWRAARAALAGIASKRDADPAAYQLAVDAVADAKDAYDAALAAATSAEAMRHQDDAEAANQMAMAHVAAVIASYDAPRIMAAQVAAKSAADAAKQAYDDAVAALAAVESIKGMDMASYDMAVAKAAAAEAAYNAAMAASNAAAAATLLADAQAQQRIAETEKDKADTANMEAMKYAGMVQDTEGSALTTAKTAAETAYNAAKMAYDAAATRVAALEAEDDDGRAKKDDNIEDYVRAKDALAQTKTAYDMAAAANTMAQDATLSTTARGHADDVQTHKGTVDTEKADVDMYANDVETAYTAAQAQRNTVEGNRLAEEQRVKDVTAARGTAMQSYMDADADATKAETAAAKAKETASGTPRAEAATRASTAARMAADNAKKAHDAIMDNMTKEQADAEASKAATQAGTANTQYMEAKGQNDAIQTAHQIAVEQQRMAAVDAATRAANSAVMAAETAKNNAAQAAMAAEQARDDAEDEYMLAMGARTDSANAKAEYEKAKAAATAARTAANAAEDAYMAAKTAADGIMDDGTADEAETAQMTAETEQGKAETEQGKAETQKKAAETAEMAAMTASGTHTLSLFKAANGAHVMDLESTMNLNEKAMHDASVGVVIAMAAKADDGAQAGTGTVVTAAWPGDVPAADPEGGSPATAAMPGMLSVSVNPAAADAIPFELGATREPDDNANPPITVRIQTAMEIDRLGVFRGFDIWEDDGTDPAADSNDLHTGDGARVIAFTNKTQDDPAVEASDAATAREVTNVVVTDTTLTKLGTKSGNMYTGAEYTPGAPSGETALTGTLTCPSGVACSIDASTTADGTVTINGVSGYVFTGSREARDAVTVADATAQAAANNDYLVFGLWLDESNDGSADTFGAFAVGGADYDANVLDEITGTASYSGKAAGAHHKTGEGVSWFDGDAGLTANFGAVAAAGTISGSISNIRVNGGAAMSTPIYLGQADLTTASATFNGVAFMGAATAPGASTHEFDGTWSGSFYGASEAVENDEATPADETVAAGALAPAAAAGTFGVTKSEGTGDDMVVESFVGAFGAHKD